MKTIIGNKKLKDSYQLYTVRAPWYYRPFVKMGMIEYKEWRAPYTGLLCKCGKYYLGQELNFILPSRPVTKRDFNNNSNLEVANNDV